VAGRGSPLQGGRDGSSEREGNDQRMGFHAGLLMFI
jgi:hypothetical protein